MVHWHVSANVGTLGSGGRSDNPGEVADVRTNVYNMMHKIKEAKGVYPKSIGIQEVGNYDVTLAPRFSTPLHTDEKVIQRDRRGYDLKRGVATYALAGEATPFDPVDDKSEIVTTVHDIIFNNGRGNKSQKVGIMNVYRLMNKGWISIDSRI